MVLLLWGQYSVTRARFYALNSSGGRLLRTGVGDRLYQMMFSEGYNFGGEPSGHFVFGTIFQPATA